MRKVLSFVLVLALVLSSFSMAFAGSSTELTSLSDVSGNTNEEAIGVVYDLGIVTGNPDGTFTPEKAVTRAEFAAMLTRALAIPDSALAAYATSSFKDTSGYAWAVPYLAFCNSKGIMLGDGAGNAMPGKTINANEAVTMTLRALGYTSVSSELVGVWPSNYVTKAQELELYDDVANTTGVDKANAAQIIYNALTVQKVAVNSDGDTNKLWDKEPKTTGSDEDKAGTATTMLSSGLNCESLLGVVGLGISMDESLINIAKYMGAYGTAYLNDEDEIVAFITEDCDTLVGRFTDTDTFTTTDGEVDYDVDTTTIGATLFSNGKDASSNDVTINATNLGALTDVCSDASIEYALNVDLSGKTIKEIYSAVKWEVTEADQISASDIADIAGDQSLLSQDFILDDNDEIDYTQFQLVGITSLSKLEADDVVYVYADDGDIRKVEVGTATATGVVKSFKDGDADSLTQFAIGANTYKNSVQVINGDVAGASYIVEDDVSDDVTAYLDARGYVYDFEDSGAATNFAVVEKTDTGISDEAKLMFADGTEKVYTYDDDADACGTLTAGAVIGYGLDSSSEISDSNKNYITTGSITLSNSKTIKTIKDAQYYSQSTITSAAVGSKAKVNDRMYTYVTGSGIDLSATIKNATIDEDCVVFTIDEDGDYDVSSIDTVELNEVITGAVLLFDENNDGSADLSTVVAMIVSDDMAGAGDKSYAVLNKRIKTANDDGDSVWNVVGYLDGVKMDTLTDDDDALNNATKSPDYTKGQAYNTLKTVHVYEVTVNATGVITGDDEVTDAYGTGTGHSNKVYRTEPLTITSADGRNSVVAVDRNGANKDSYAISDEAVFYRVTSDDEYVIYNGDLKDTDSVILYETNGNDDDNDGYDIVVFVR